MNIPGLGDVTRNAEFGWYWSDPIPVSVLNGLPCRIVVAGYDEDHDHSQFHTTIQNFLSIGPSALLAVGEHIFAYYVAVRDAGDFEVPLIRSASEVWSHVVLGTEAVVKRRGYGDMEVYVSVACECDWEPEHGLQIVFRRGLEVVKVGPYDGHCTNSDAYDDDELENVIFVRW
jgi:hypothetical protein